MCTLWGHMRPEIADLCTYSRHVRMWKRRWGLEPVFWKPHTAMAAARLRNTWHFMPCGGSLDDSRGSNFRDCARFTLQFKKWVNF